MLCVANKTMTTFLPAGALGSTSQRERVWFGQEVGLPKHLRLVLGIQKHRANAGRDGRLVVVPGLLCASGPRSRGVGAAPLAREARATIISTRFVLCFSPRRRDQSLRVTRSVPVRPVRSQRRLDILSSLVPDSLLSTAALNRRTSWQTNVLGAWPDFTEPQRPEDRRTVSVTPTR